MNRNPEPNSGNFELPQPSLDAIELSQWLITKIVERIEQRGGVIGFDEYMQMALYEPGLGYYMAGSTKLGADGDFVTAPEISELFGQCLANQLSTVIQQGCPSAVLEFGAGSGRLCAQILEALPELERYLILDLSAELTQRQQSYLQQRLSEELFGKIEWLQQLPVGFNGIVLANEVLDAMPVHLVEKQDRWLELGIGFDGDRFHWCLLDPSAKLQAALTSLETRLGEFAPGYRTELNLNLVPWMQALADSGERVLALIIDYGFEQAEYYAPGRSAGTLICHYRHRVHDDPLVYPGLQDITAFVDFDAAADAAETAGFEPVGLVTQAEFLLANGLLEVTESRAADCDERERISLAQQVKTLTLPQEMGHKFKVLALQKGLDFSIRAMRRRGLRG